MNDDILEATDSITETATSTMPADAPATLPEGMGIEPQSVPEAAPATSPEAAPASQHVEHAQSYRKHAGGFTDDPYGFKQRDLMGKVADLVRVRRELEQLREEKKASAAAFSEKEKALDATIGTLVDGVDKLTWVVSLDEDNGIVYRTNRITGETTSQTYEPPKQRELSLEDQDDDGSRAPRSAARKPKPVETVSDPEHVSEPQEVSDTEEREGEPVREGTPPGVEPCVWAVITETWQSVGEVASRLAWTPKKAGYLLKGLVAAGWVEAMGQKRGRKYRRMVGSASGLEGGASEQEAGHPAAGLITHSDEDRCDQESDGNRSVTEEDESPVSVQNRIRWYMVDFDWLSLGEIVEGIGLEEATVRAALAVLVEDGDVESSGTDKDSDRVFRVVER